MYWHKQYDVLLLLIIILQYTRFEYVTKNKSRYSLFKCNDEYIVYILYVQCSRQSADLNDEYIVYILSADLISCADL